MGIYSIKLEGGRMTKEEAIQILIAEKKAHCIFARGNAKSDEPKILLLQALDMAISALSVFDNWSKCESKEKIPYDKNMRLINSRQIVYSWTTDLNGKEHDGITLESIINTMPTVDVSALSQIESEKTEIENLKSEIENLKTKIENSNVKSENEIKVENHEIKVDMINREEVLEELNRIKNEKVSRNGGLPKIDRAINCVTELSTYSVKAEGDLISRKAVLNLAKDLTFEGGCKHRCIDATEIELLPTYSAERETLHDSINAVLEDIKAEIELAKWCDKETRLVKNCNASGLEVALDIINKHITKLKGDTE